jgi:hypothetical protein
MDAPFEKGRDSAPFAFFLRPMIKVCDSLSRLVVQSVQWGQALKDVGRQDLTPRGEADHGPGGMEVNLAHWGLAPVEASV